MKKLCPECNSQLLSYSKKKEYYCYDCTSTFDTPIEKDRLSRTQIALIATLIMVAITAFLAAILYSMVVALKPAIYLYTPEEKKESLRLKVKGRITMRIPWRKGTTSVIWNDLILKNGKIISDNKEFDYLFYESENIVPKHDGTGWTLKRQGGNLYWNNEPIGLEQLPGIFTEILKKYGLFENEISDFNEYWFAEDMKIFFGQDEFTYGIYPISLEELDRIFSIETELEYAEYIRVQFLVKEIKEGINLNEPAFPEVKRSEYALHEWGMIKG